MKKDSRDTIPLERSILPRVYYQCRGRASTISLKRKMKACAFFIMEVLKTDEWHHYQFG